jgi:Ala-tRNA(Pro) deacylase
LERARGFEPPTPTLARLCSTPELHPRPAAVGRPAALLILARGVGFARLALAAAGPHRSAVMAPPLTPEELFARLDALGIAHRTYSHPPVFTVAEATALRGSLPGGHCKSLFLKDKKGGFWLAVMLEERRTDLKKLAARLGAPRFSFGGADDLYEFLGVRPGSVTPFALVNDVARRVTPVLDAVMLEHDPLNYHPLANDRTTAVAPADLLRFIAACGHEARIIDLAGCEREPAAAG